MQSDKLQNIVHNIGWLSFDKVLRMGVGLVVGIWVASYLGPEQHGFEIMLLHLQVFLVCLRHWVWIALLGAILLRIQKIAMNS